MARALSSWTPAGVISSIATFAPGALSTSFSRSASVSREPSSATCRSRAPISPPQPRGVAPEQTRGDRERRRRGAEHHCGHTARRRAGSWITRPPRSARRRLRRRRTLPADRLERDRAARARARPRGRRGREQHGGRGEVGERRLAGDTALGEMRLEPLAVLGVEARQRVARAQLEMFVAMLAHTHSSCGSSSFKRINPCRVHDFTVPSGALGRLAIALCDSPSK